MQYLSPPLLAFVGAFALLGSIGCEPGIRAPRSVSADAPSDSVEGASPGEVVMPTPTSVTPAEPGGDAPDKEAAALTRLATSDDDGYRTDKWQTLHVGLLDPRGWRRVRVFGTPTRASFRYGDASYALASTVYEPAEGASDPRSCLAQFMRSADELATSYGVEYEASPVFDRERAIDGVATPIEVVLAEGKVRTAFLDNDYVAAIVSYPSFAGTCLVQSFAAVATRHPDIARRARDRWVTQAAPLLTWNPSVGDVAPEFDTR